MRAKILVSLAVTLVMTACEDTPARRDGPPPSHDRDHGAPRVEEERPTPPEPEVSPLQSDARSILDEHVSGALDARSTAIAFEVILSDASDVPLQGGPDWTVSSRRALVHALRTAPSTLRDELKRYQDERSRFEIGNVRSDMAEGRLAKAAKLADRYPNATFALEFWKRLAKETAATPHDPVDVSLLAAPVPAGGMRVGGLSLKSEGDDGIIASDADRTATWTYKAHESPSVRLLGSFLDRLIVLELGKGAFFLEGIDAATGSDIFRVTLPVKETPIIVLAGPDAVVMTSHRICVVDILRGKLGWERGHEQPLPMTVTQDRIIFGPEGAGFDLATGRLAAGTTPKPPRGGSAIEVR